MKETNDCTSPDNEAWMIAQRGDRNKYYNEQCGGTEYRPKEFKN